MFIENSKKTFINGETKVVGLFGDPVSHSFSPTIHNAAFREKGLNLYYLPFRVSKDDLPAAVRAIAFLGFKGVNVTAPHKEAVIPYMDELSSEADFLKAVNTIKNEKDRMVGYNTDVDGFLYLLQNNLGNAFPLKEALLLGAGGAARAVSLALAKAGFESLVIANRTTARAEELASLLMWGGIFNAGKVKIVKLEKNFRQENIESSALIINALSEDPVKLGYLAMQNLQGCRAAVDLRYSPLQTPFGKWAENKGILAINGLDMLLGQGIKAFEIFTGEEAPSQIMKEALQNALNNVC